MEGKQLTITDREKKQIEAVELTDFEKSVIKESKEIAFLYGISYDLGHTILILNALRRVPYCKCTKDI